MNRALVLKIALGVQLAFFAGWSGWLAASHRDAPEVWLETNPVDPRNLLSGHYVALSFAIGAPADADLLARGEGERSRMPVWVELAPASYTVTAGGLEVRPHRAVRWSRVPPGNREAGMWAQGTMSGRAWGPRVEFGIEKFFVNEKSRLRTATSGSVIARATLGRDGRLRVTDLVEKRPAPATPPTTPP